MPAEPQAASSGNDVAPPSAVLMCPQEGDRSAGNSVTDPSRFPALAALPLQLDISVPIPNFRVRDLLALDKGSVFETSWSYTEDVPVWCGGAQLLWTEFEVVDDVLSVRVTRVL
jgi:flagellar motor switch/type III secretory pathway protein FliN